METITPPLTAPDHVHEPAPRTYYQITADIEAAICECGAHIRRRDLGHMRQSLTAWHVSN
jgi:hypothetical protein